MKKFDINKVLTPLDAQEKDLTELIGKEFYYSDYILRLKRGYERNESDEPDKGKLTHVSSGFLSPFTINNSKDTWQFLYPVDEKETRPYTEEEFIDWWKTSDCKVQQVCTNNCYMVTMFYYGLYDSDTDKTLYIETDAVRYTLKQFCDTFTKLDGSKFEVTLEEE